MSRRTTMPEPWAGAAEKLGGVAPLAKALGIGTATLWRWAAGTHRPPNSVHADAVRAKFRRWKLADPWPP